MNATDASRWLRFAHEDLSAAEGMLGQAGSFPRHACWLAQQAAEKALKAALVFLQIEFPFTHDLDRLRSLLPDGWRVKSAPPSLFSLSVWAAQARYPTNAPEAVDADAYAAVQLARTVADSVTGDLRQRGATIK